MDDEELPDYADEDLDYLPPPGSPEMEEAIRYIGEALVKTTGFMSDFFTANASPLATSEYAAALDATTLTAGQIDATNLTMEKLQQTLKDIGEGALDLSGAPYWDHPSYKLINDITYLPPLDSPWRIEPIERHRPYHTVDDFGYPLSTMPIWPSPYLGDVVTPEPPPVKCGPYYQRRIKRWRQAHPSYTVGNGQYFILNQREIVCHPDDVRKLEQAVKEFHPVESKEKK